MTQARIHKHIGGPLKPDNTSTTTLATDDDTSTDEDTLEYVWVEFSHFPENGEEDTSMKQISGDTPVRLRNGELKLLGDLGGEKSLSVFHEGIWKDACTKPDPQVRRAVVYLDVLMHSSGNEEADENTLSDLVKEYQKQLTWHDKKIVDVTQIRVEVP